MRVKRTKNGCLMWLGSTDDCGYGRLNLKKPGRTAHRIMFQLTHGKIGKGNCVCHTCDNPACIEPTHLWLGKHAENMQDMVTKKRQARGKQIPRAKLEDWERKSIARKYIPYVTSYASLGKKHKVTGETARQVVLRYSNKKPKNNHGKLTPQQRQQIVLLHSTGKYSLVALGKKFGIGRSTAQYTLKKYGKIRSNKNWRTKQVWHARLGHTLRKSL